MATRESLATEISLNIFLLVQRRLSRNHCSLIYDCAADSDSMHTVLVECKTEHRENGASQ